MGTIALTSHRRRDAMTFAAPLTHTVRDHHSHLAAYAPRSATPGATLAALERAVSVRGTSGPW
jgi:hypothetical protein